MTVEPAPASLPEASGSTPGAAAPRAGALTIPESYANCEARVRAAQSNFFRAFQLLPAERRKAIYANYAFMRHVDDLSDEVTAGASEKLAALRAALKRIFVTEPDPTLVGLHPTLPALVHAALRYRIDPAIYQSLLDGVEADLTVTRYATFEELKKYCYNVAGVVGLVCVSIWADDHTGIAEKAVAGGYAVQLTNIIRDVAEDGRRGRIYLPAEDLARFGVREEELLRGADSTGLRQLLAFEAARARAFFAQAYQVKEQIRPDCRRAWWMTLGAYEKLLDRMEKRGFDVMRGRVRLTTWDKIALYMKLRRVK